mgnify:CR=1 FL=1|jgi:monoamine oxidase
MNPRIGRPKSDNPKNIDVKVRFDEETHNKMLEYCKENNISRTELIRMGVGMILDK